MLEILVMKQVDIYISIATSIFGAILGFILSYFYSPTIENSGHTTNIIQTVTIKNIKNNAKSLSKSSQADDQVAMLFGGLFLFSGLTVYLFFRTTILYALLYSEVLLLSMWLGAVSRAYIFGGFKGFSWLVYLIYIAFFLVAYFIAIQLAFNPIHAPQNFQFAEEIINRSGWVGIKHYFIKDDLLWGVVHLAGISLLIFVFWQISLSLLHMLLSARYILNSAPENESWIVRKTARYCTPWINIIAFSVIIILACSMVSGLFVHWMQNEIPAYIKHILNIVMYGKD
jgi:hypothetical protein